MDNVKGLNGEEEEEHMVQQQQPDDGDDVVVKNTQEEQQLSKDDHATGSKVDEDEDEEEEEDDDEDDDDDVMVDIVIEEKAVASPKGQKTSAADGDDAHVTHHSPSSPRSDDDAAAADLDDEDADLGDEGPYVVKLYSLANYTFGIKEAKVEKDRSVVGRMGRQQREYESRGMRTHVEGVLLVHNHGHPHVLLMQLGDSFFKCPGGKLALGESDTSGLRRKLNSKLAPTSAQYQTDWEIADHLCSWWRPNFENLLYPYCPTHITKPKECRKVYLCPLPKSCIFAVPRNYRLLAVPLYDLYDNPSQYGAQIAALPLLLSRYTFVCE